MSGNAQVPEVGSYAYDGVGNLLTDPSGTYTYTPFNLLETATVGGRTTTYRYGGDNRRALRVLPDRTDFFYHGLSEYALDAGALEARWVRDYLYLGGRLAGSLSRR